MKATKTIVQAKTRSLCAEWTVEAPQDISGEISDELAKILQQEIDNEIMSRMRESQGWTKVTVKRWKNINNEWCKKYIKHKYNCFGHYWYFENEQDAHFFMLKWGTV
jgi:hypothetical protein